MVEKVSVMEEDWDYIIILDACRYDYFSELYKPYLCGELKKVISPGSSTIEWCKESFQEKYNDVVYISSNPFINSKVEVLNFNAKDHFYKVIDVWDWGWDEKLGTVHPKTVNEAVQSFKDYYPDKRFIIHYLQPHEPYIGYSLGFPKPEFKKGEWRWGDPIPTRQHSKVKKVIMVLSKSSFAQNVSRILTKCFNEHPLWKMRRFLNLPELSPMDVLRRKVGDAGLQEAYEENLKLVLGYVKKLIQGLQGNIIITSDHGERLGEGNHYSHFDGISDSFLVEVPWFKVKKAVG